MSSEVVVPQSPKAETIPSEDTVKSISGSTSFLKRLTSSLFGVAAGVTASAASMAVKTRLSLLPVLAAISDNARAVSDLTLLGAIFSKPDSKVRSIYDASTNLAARSQKIVDTTPQEVKEYESIVRTPEEILAAVKGTPLPSRRPELPEPVPSKKKKKKGSKPANRRGAKKPRRRY
jgi:hypothetical protein